MPISVTTSETTETYTTWVNGHPIERSETTKIHVIEPADNGRQARGEKSGKSMSRTGSRSPDGDGLDQRSIWRERAWMAAWIVWIIYLLWEYSCKVCVPVCGSTWVSLLSCSRRDEAD